MEELYGLLRLTLTGLAAEVDYLVCYNCYAYGKIGQYYATICPICEVWCCDDCSNIKKYTIEENTYELCKECYTDVTDNCILAKIVDKTNPSKPAELHWNVMTNLFNDPEEVVEFMLDIINEQLEGGEYYQYEVNQLHIFRGMSDESYVVLIYNTRDNYTETDNDDTNSEGFKEELVEELVSIVYNGMDLFRPGSELMLNNDQKEKIVLDLHFV